MFEFLLPYVDYLFLGGAVILDLAFLPTLLRPHNKPDRWTSVMFTLVLFSMVFGFLALSLPYAAIAQTVGAGMWGISIFQRRL